MSRPTRILVSNPNRIEACTRLIDEQARIAAGPDIEILTVQPHWGPVELASELEATVSAVGVLDAIRSTDVTYDAVVLAGFGEPGTEAVRRMVDCPVVDITEAAPMTAMLLGRSFGIVTSTHAAVPLVADRLRQLGLDSRCAGIDAVGLGVPELVGDPAAALRAIHGCAQEVLTRTRCDTIVLGCAGMAGFADELAKLLMVPVVDPLRAAVTGVQQLLSTVPTIPVDPYRSELTAHWPFARSGRTD